MDRVRKNKSRTPICVIAVTLIAVVPCEYCDLLVASTAETSRTAGQARDRSKNWAMFVGLNDYRNLAGLEYSRTDAQAMFELLTDSVTGLFDRKQTCLLTDAYDRSDSRYPSKENIMQRLDWIAKKARGGDRVLFYFSGHGYSVSGINYVCPPDYELSRPEETGISLAMVNEKLRKSNSTHQLVIVDACRAIGKSVGKSFVFVDSIPTIGRFDLYATRAGGFSYESDDLQHGVFTAALLEGLSGKACRDSSDCISVADLKQYAEHFVISWSEHTGYKQAPRFGGDYQGEPSRVILVTFDRRK